MTVKTGFADEVAERQQWLLDMWRVQQAIDDEFGDAIGLLKSKRGKPIKLVQSKISQRSAESLRAALDGEESLGEIRHAWRTLAEQEAERKKKCAAEGSQPRPSAAGGTGRSRAGERTPREKSED